MDNSQERVFTREEMLAAYRAYKKEWREKNPEKIKAAQDRWALKRAAELQSQREKEQRKLQGCADLLAHAVRAMGGGDNE